MRSLTFTVCLSRNCAMAICDNPTVCLRMKLRFAKVLKTMKSKSAHVQQLADVMLVANYKFKHIASFSVFCQVTE